MKALITGGSGYFGSLFLHKLTKQDIDCRIFDLKDTEDRFLNVEFIQGDIRNYSAVADACKGIDVVYHNVLLLKYRWRLMVTGYVKNF